MQQQDPTIRVAVDIGGTFTDLHLHDPVSGRNASYKTPSTPADPSIGLINGLQGITRQAGIALHDIGLILHGSTIATNAVLERKLPSGALITTMGFRDVLEIGRHIRNDVYTLKAESRSVLIPRHRRFGVKERIDAQGNIQQPLDEHALLAIVDQLLELEVETVAIVFLHGYRNPQHEQRAAEIVAQRAPGLSLTCSYLCSPEIREFERTSTTVLNALLRPVISGYLERVTQRLKDSHINAALYLVQSNGGLATPADAAKLPAKLLLSGPAGGAMAMASLSGRHGLANLVGLDMGGTSSDISVVLNGLIGETTESSIDGLPVRMPMVEMRTIGAGGGSIARVESDALRVGPISAGAEPGPVCYQRGGTKPTVTDANVALGRIDTASFRTGGMELDVQSAHAALEKEISSPLELDTLAAAAGILNVTTATMAAAIRLSLFEKGADPGDFTLVPFGGAAGLHACAVAQELGVSQIVFPAHASTLSALGILQADLRYDLSDSQLLPANASAIAELAASVTRLRRDANELLDNNGLAASERRIEISCDMRYRGQAFELATPWPQLQPNNTPDAALLQELISNFHQLHEERFAYVASADAVEIVTLRAVAVGLLQNSPGQQQSQAPAPENRPQLADQSRLADQLKTGKRKTRTVFLHGDHTEIPCYSRDELPQQTATLYGPLLVEEDYTVLLIEQDWKIHMIETGDIVCEHTSPGNTFSGDPS